MVPALVSFGELLGTLDQTASNLAEAAPTSLIEYTKNARIMSRAYIDSTIANEDIMLSLMGYLNQMYVGYILTALSLNQYVDKSRTVKDLIKTVSTEGVFIDASEAIDKFNSNILDISIETMKPSIEGDESSIAKAELMDMEKTTQRLMTGRIIQIDLVTMSHRVMNTTKEDSIKMKQVVDKNGDISGDNETGSKTTTTEGDVPEKITLFLYVQIFPQVVAPEVISELISVGTVPTTARRWLQVKAGEIRFIKDFLFATDLIKKHRDAIRKDKSGVLNYILQRKNNALVKHFADVTANAPKSHNLINNILIVEKRTFQRACDAAGLKITSTSQRNKFFASTFIMSIIVVDTMYNTVEMYFHGIDGRGDYTYSTISKLGQANKSDFELKEVMTSFANNSAPKF